MILFIDLLICPSFEKVDIVIFYKVIPVILTETLSIFPHLNFSSPLFEL